MIDTHCHLDFDRFDSDRDKVVENALNHGVERIIIPGIDIETSKKAILLSEQYQHVFASIGFHPNNLPDAEDSSGAMNELLNLSSHQKVIAIGEIGLDYHWNTHPKEKQYSWFKAQLELASTISLPVIIHNRKSTEDILHLLSEWIRYLPADLTDRPGTLHSFSGNETEMMKAQNLGFYIGFTGPITYKNADETRVCAKYANRDKILTETDAPFLTPQQHRGKRNEPAYVRFVVEKLAEIRESSFQDIDDLTTNNAKTLFKI